MYSRSYNKNRPLNVPRQYSGVAFARPRERESVAGRAVIGTNRSPVGYSPEAGERLYAPSDLPSVNAPMPIEYGAVGGERSDIPEAGTKPAEVAKARPSFLSSVGALGEDTLLIIALILLLAGSEGAEDTLILLVLLLLLG